MAMVLAAAPAVLEQDVKVRVHGSVAGKHVNGDRRLLVRVLLNIVQNAAQAIGEQRDGVPASAAKILRGEILIRALVNDGRTEIKIPESRRQ